jgi:betaine-aldehyde dehydrogenase
VRRTVAAARRSSAAWSRSTPRERAARLLALADLMSAEATQYASDECAGTGKLPAHAHAEVLDAIDLLRFYAGAARADLTPASGGRLAGHESWVRWEAMGVVAAIVPWNYPLMMAMWRVAPALAAGNGVVLKPAESTPDSALRLALHAREALGPGVLDTLTGDRTTGRLLAGSDVDVIALTGSSRAGEDVSRAAGTRRVSLELGGNCAALVLPDAPDFTYDALVRASAYNAGQSCAAPARVITLRECYDDVLEGLGRAVQATSAGRDLGPLNNPDQVARHDRLVGATQARWSARGACAPPVEHVGGYWRAPSVLADLPDDDPVVLEEMFAPVLTVQATDTVEQALRLANSVPQALAASVWSRALDASLTAARGLNAGEVWINCHLVQTAELPHGGRGASGTGTDLSVLALSEYQRPKTITAYLGA